MSNEYMISHTQLQHLLEAAAEKGAKQALAHVGLHDDEAISDVRELRGLLDAWRSTKRTVGQTIAKILTTALLAILAAGLLVHFNGGK